MTIENSSQTQWDAGKTIYGRDQWSSHYTLMLVASRTNAWVKSIDIIMLKNVLKRRREKKRGKKRGREMKKVPISPPIKL